MRRGSTLLLTTLVAVIALALPAAAFIRVSVDVGYTITTAEEFPDEGDDPGEEPPAEQVWICKFVGPPDQPRVREHDNPMQVSAEATTDGRFNDEHGSPVVPEDTDCSEIALDDEPPSEQRPKREGRAADEEQVTDEESGAVETSQ